MFFLLVLHKDVTKKRSDTWTIFIVKVARAKGTTHHFSGCTEERMRFIQLFIKETFT